MINGGMAEAQRGFAVLDGVDEETIRRYIEWAYKGYYTAAHFRQVHQRSLKKVSTKEKGEEPEKVEFIDTFAGDAAFEGVIMEPSLSWLPEPDVELLQDNLRSRKQQKSSKKSPGAFHYHNFTPTENDKHHQTSKNKRELKESFLKYDYRVRRDTITLPPTRGNLGPLEDYTDVFLSHARLYVFAEMYDIQILKQLALEELHSTLANYTLYDSRADDIIALLRYVYANTSSEEGDSGGQELRKLLTDYMGCEMGILTKSGGFKDLMFEDGGDLLGDYMKMVALRIDDWVIEDWRFKDLMLET